MSFVHTVQLSGGAPSTWMIDPYDKVVKAIFYNSHDTDFWRQRKDGTIYVQEIRKGHDDRYYEPEIQLDLNYE